MSTPVTIHLHPMGISITVEKGTSLQDVLFAYGVEFPCGGRGRCKGCRVRVLEGDLPLSPEQGRMLSAEEQAAGWRLSCQCAAEGDLSLELAQWEAQVLSDTTQFSFEPREGLGIAVDVGTTTIVAQLLDLQTADVLAVRTALNPQARHGADIMSRIGYAVVDGGHAKLVGLLRERIEHMVQETLETAARRNREVREIVLVGNTVMHHLFCDISLEPLSHYPFEATELAERCFTADALGWKIPGNPTVRFLPCIGSFVGSDVLAGVFATGLHTSSVMAGLIDLGTNGEMVFGSSRRLVCASTAAGPAFEGARIMMGMRAATGAVAEVHVQDGRLVAHVLGNVSPRGICGSGLVDSVAGMLDLGIVGGNGRFAGGERSVMVAPPVKLSQTDIRELQLAKGAIAAGVRLLVREVGVEEHAVASVHLAGAFGNYINVGSALRVGLLPFTSDQIQPAGNTALRGAKMALFTPPEVFADLARNIEHISLSVLPEFQDTYVNEMLFPS